MLHMIVSCFVGITRLTFLHRVNLLSQANLCQEPNVPAMDYGSWRVYLLTWDLTNRLTRVPNISAYGERDLCGTVFGVHTAPLFRMYPLLDLLLCLRIYGLAKTRWVLSILSGRCAACLWPIT